MMRRAALPALILMLLPATFFYLMCGVAADANACAGLSVAPPCCPSPCAILDVTRSPLLQTLAQNATLLAGWEEQTNGLFGVVMAAVGSGPGGTTFPALDATWSGPAGTSASPTDSLVAIKQSLFEPLPPVAAAATDIARRDQARAATATTEAVAGLAIGLQHVVGLPRSASAGADSSRQPPADIHGAMDRLGGARLVMLADLAAMEQLWTAALAKNSSGAAKFYPVPAITGGSNSPIPIAASASPGKSPAPMPSSKIESTLVPQQRAAQAILASYPSLQRTVTIATLAQRIEAAASADLADALTRAGQNPLASLRQIQTSLLRLDRTVWQDGDRKEVAARSAASQMVPQLVLQPDSGSAALLRQTMAAWLDANKQALYWRALAGEAQAEITMLDQRLGEISDRAGFDVTGSVSRQPAIRR